MMKFTLKTLALAGVAGAMCLLAGGAAAQSWPQPWNPDVDARGPGPGGTFGSGYGYGYGGYGGGRIYGHAPRDAGYGGYRTTYQAYDRRVYSGRDYGYAPDYGRTGYGRTYASPPVAQRYHTPDVVYAPVARTVKVVPVVQHPQLYQIQGYGYGYRGY